MRTKYLIAGILAILLMAAVAAFAVAQTEPPAPYAGLKNPFAWSDAQAQAAGKILYEKNCAGCHGPRGNGIPQFDFSTPAYSQKLEARADFYFWALSEGRISSGMPGYKSSLSEAQRWQTLTYMWLLGTAPPPISPTPTKLPVEGVSISLISPPEGDTGEELTFSAILKDAQGKPISGATVKYYLAEEFFARGQMEIGEAATNEQGTATFNHTPTRSGKTTVTARYETVEKANALSINDSGRTFYVTEAGIEAPSGGPEVFLGPESAHELGEMGEAPTSALRLPGGLFSWLWLFVGVLMLVWGVYFIIMYQVLHISLASQVSDILRRKTTDTRLVPLVGLIAIFGLGLLMVLMVITGPFSHFHLMP